jgi:hypothetical protein
MLKYFVSRFRQLLSRFRRDRICTIYCSTVQYCTLEVKYSTVLRLWSACGPRVTLVSYIVSMLLLQYCNTVISNANTSTIILFGDMQQDESSHHFVFHGRPAAPLISFFFVNSNKISP